MLYSALVVAAAAFSGFAAAQNQTFNTPIPCCSVPANQVPSDTKSTWCDANRNTCVDLCGGQAKIGSNGNTCDSSTLQFTCKCTNGTDVSSSMRNYQQSVPGQMCRLWYGQCINATGSDAAAQFNCNQARDTQCGNLTTKSESGSSSSVSPSASRTGGGSSAGSPTGAAPGAASSAPGAAAGLVQYSTPVLAAGLLAVFGIAM